MKLSLKDVGVFMAVQVLLCIALGFIAYMLSPNTDFLSGAVIYAYYPTIYGIWKVGYFAGESNMFMPILIGIPLGIFIYGVIFSLIFNYFKQSNS